MCLKVFQPRQAAIIVEDRTSSLACESPETLLIMNFVRGTINFSNSFENVSLHEESVIFVITEVYHRLCYNHLMENRLFEMRRFLPATIDNLMATKDLAIWDNEPCPLPFNLPFKVTDREKFDKEVAKLLRSRARKHLSGEVFTASGFKCVTSPESHIGPFVQALDIIVPDGTLVVAAAPGTVTEIVENNMKHGGPEAARFLNYTTLRHKVMRTDIYTQYCHLGQGSVSKEGLKVGMAVEAGQPLGRTKMVGWTDEEHLHFIAFRGDRDPENPFGFKSLMLRFI